ncbi:MAG: Do family serine endopeptidase [Comamonadaceae bacterium]|nr:Do family serine endopeptidase [Comamonadaceae bacterium]
MKTRTLVAAAAALAIGGTSLSMAEAWTLPAWMRPQASSQASAGTVVASAAPTAAAPAPIAPLPAGSMPNYRAIVKAEGPAVVGVTVSGLRQPDGADGPSLDNDPFYRFFRGLPGFPGGRLAPPGAQPFRGQGSGFIVSPDGLILTNAHVVRDAKQVSVKLSDRREFTAKVLGSDTATDIAVLKIDAKGLPTVTLGDSKAVQVGDYVLAIGAPYGFAQSATQGIVSAKGRSLPGDSVVPFIQTDAAVNPGNSGGPLFDAGGRVVGINAQIFSQSGGFQGLAFAIPIDVALGIKDQIVTHGRVEHARLGVMLQDLSAPLADSFGLKAPDGALVSSVAKGSAAAAAGLKAGDVITQIDGRDVQTAGDVSTRVGMARPGERITLGVWRDKARHELQVALGKAEADKSSTVAGNEGGALGLAVRPLDKNELREAGVDHGLLVEQAQGPAQLAGVQAGDVLLAVNGKPARSVDQVRDALRDHPRHVALLVARDGQQIFIPVDLG